MTIESEIERLREENERLRRLVARLRELARRGVDLDQIADDEPEQKS